MTRYHALALATEYWKPREDYLSSIVDELAGRVCDGDFVVVSEKALSTALGNIINESSVKTGFNSKVICRFWMRYVWGYCLSVICHLGRRLTQRLREYPLDEGSRHKQVALQHAGLLQALMWGSEGGIDGSNLPFSYVSLPLLNPYEVAEAIRKQIWCRLKKKVYVIIVDTDKTYSFRNFHFTPRPNPIRGIHSFGGVVTYVIGRALRFRKRPTPLATAGCVLQAEEALKIANVADRARGVGSGATVWDMAARFHVAVAEIDWRMLAQMKHKPIVIVRKSGAV